MTVRELRDTLDRMTRDGWGDCELILIDEYLIAIAPGLAAEPMADLGKPLPPLNPLKFVLIAPISNGPKRLGISFKQVAKNVENLSKALRGERF